ncbi:MAG: 50S ribosomal protein L11 methyltransferase, partial [Planctomycetota bacterium]
MNDFACDEAPSGSTLVRILLPDAWDETLVALLAEGGFGDAVAESRFESGALASDPVDAGRLSEVRLVVLEQELTVLRDCLAQWRRQWGIDEASFRLQEEPHDPDEVDPEILWRAQWRPFRCAGFVIHADFHEVEHLGLRPSDQRLALLPGSAFGTGGHASTRLALKIIASWCRDEPPARLLDVG